MIKQFVAPIGLVLALVAVVACAPAASAPSAAPTAQQETPTEQAAAEAPTAQQEAPTEQGAIDVTDPGILVIDPDTPLCVIFPTLNGDGQQYASRGTENGDVANPGDFSHGEIVFGTVIEAMGPANITSDPNLVTPDTYQDAVVILIVDNFRKPSGNVEVPERTLNQDENILIAGVDIGSWEIDVVQKNIENAISDLISDPAQPVVRKFVINMSFAIVPCNNALKETLTQYEAGNLAFGDFSMNLKALINQAYGNGRANIPSQITTRFFAEFTECLFGGHLDNRSCGNNLKVPANANIILVGAAGNSGYSFPFAPALFPYVVSVSACDKDADPACYSNTGEVMMDGTTGFSDVIGTSFASPKLALAEAERLLSIQEPVGSLGIECTGVNGKSSPPFGYIPESGLNWESPDVHMQTDLPLAEVQNRYCNP